MTPEQFCYWLKGFFELTEKSDEITERQSKIIQDHLNLVFKKVTPDRPAQFDSTAQKDIIDFLSQDGPLCDSGETPECETPELHSFPGVTGTKKEPVKFC